MFWHIDTDIVGLLVMCLLHYYTIKMLPGDMYTAQNKSFVWCLRSGIIMTAIDIAASVIMDIPFSRPLYHILMTLYLLVQDLMIVMWIMYALTILYKSDDKGRKCITRGMWLLYAAYALLVLTNPWTGFFFTLGENMEYARGPLFLPCLLGLYYIYAISLVVMTIIRRGHIPEGYPKIVLVIQPIILSVAIPIQLLNPGWLTIFPAYMLCLVLAFLYFQNLRVRNERAQLYQLTEIVEHFTCGMSICTVKDGEICVQYVSGALADIYEMEPSALRDMYNRDMLSNVYPEDREMVDKHLKDMVVKRSDQEMTFRCVTGSGTQKWVNIRAKPTIDKNGVVTIYTTYTDLTEQKRAEQQLRENQKELWAKYELEKKRISMSEENLIVHAMFNLTTGEPAEYRMRDDAEAPEEIKRAFAYGNTCAGLIIEGEERERFAELNNADSLLSRFADGETEFRMEYRRMLPNGDVTWVRDAMHLLRDPRNGNVLLFEYWYNIETEKMLELMYRSIATDNYDFVARIDGISKKFDVIAKTGINYHMPPQSGDDADAVTLSLYSDYVIPEDRETTIYNSLIENTKKHLRENGRFVFTYRMMRPDNSLRYKRVTQYYIDQQREIIAMMREDVTDLICSETEKNKMMADALETANQASLAKTQFLSRVSHELRTPLNAIIGFLELAKDADREQKETYLLNSDVAAKQLLAIINDVLDVSSIESGKLRIAYAPFNFTRLIKSIGDLYLPQCRQKGIGFETVMVTHVDEWLRGDQLRVKQILFNLLNNALKFTSQGGISLKISQRPAQQGKVIVRFEVSDTGCGMSEEMQKRLFKPFEQESATTAQRYGGNGLGLFIVGSLVSMMDGVISVESRPGKGTVFNVSLPLTKNDEELAQYKIGNERHKTDDGEQTVDTAESFSFPGKRILLAEDNAMNRMVAETMITKKFEVMCECAEDGKTAVDMFLSSAEAYYDAILMDIQMPNMDGFEATKLIRASSRADAAAVQIIALTANAFNEDVEKSLSNGMNAHVAKPIEMDVLGAALSQAFSARQKAEENIKK